MSLGVKNGQNAQISYCKIKSNGSGTQIAIASISNVFSPWQAKKSQAHLNTTCYMILFIQKHVPLDKLA